MAVFHELTPLIKSIGQFVDPVKVRLVTRQLSSQTKGVNLITHQFSKCCINHSVPRQRGFTGEFRTADHRLKMDSVISADRYFCARQPFKYHLRYCCAIRKLSSFVAGQCFMKNKHRTGEKYPINTAWPGGQTDLTFQKQLS